MLIDVHDEEASNEYIWRWRNKQVKSGGQFGKCWESSKRAQTLNKFSVSQRK